MKSLKTYLIATIASIATVICFIEVTKIEVSKDQFSSSSNNNYAETVKFSPGDKNEISDFTTAALASNTVVHTFG